MRAPHRPGPLGIETFTYCPWHSMSWINIDTELFLDLFEIGNAGIATLYLATEQQTILSVFQIEERACLIPEL